MPERRCGTCYWWARCVANVGGCHWSPDDWPTAWTENVAAIRIPMTSATYGTTCPCYRPREEASETDE